MPEQWKYAAIEILHKKDRTQCDNFRGVALVAHAGKALLKIVTRRLSAYITRGGAYFGNNTAAFVPGVRLSTCCSSFAECRRLQRLGKSPSTRVLHRP